MFDSAVILLADAEGDRRQFIASQLIADTATVHTADSVAAVLARAAIYRPDALVLAELDTTAGAVEVIRGVRSAGALPTEPAADLPILALVPDGDELSMLRCCEAGADDVATRSETYPVLRARVRMLLGLAGRHRVVPVWRLGPLQINPLTREVRLRDEQVALSVKEYDLLSALAAEPTRVFTRAELLRDVWGFHHGALTPTLDSHASRLRRKLRAQGDGFLINVWGVGYKLTDRAPRELEVAA
jgi:DNA-binding response OmpR family regulator